MKIHELSVQNFRGFVEKTIILDDCFTLLVGDNATGKTGLLDALAVAIGGTYLLLPSDVMRSICWNDVRKVVYEFDGLPDLQPQYPVTVAWRGTLDGETFHCSLVGDAPQNRDELSDTHLLDLSKRIQEAVQRGLIARIGSYCSYCGMRLDACLAVEHIQPKVLRPDLLTTWINLLLSCANCNSVKGGKL